MVMTLTMHSQEVDIMSHSAITLIVVGFFYVLLLNVFASMTDDKSGFIRFLGYLLVIASTLAMLWIIFRLFPSINPLT